MSRGFGEVEAIQSVVPDWLAVVIALITQLGDGWFLFALLVWLYLTRHQRRDDVLLVGGLLACGVGLYRGLKYLFRLPRPGSPVIDSEVLPSVIAPLYEGAAHATGYGFPSGHATSAAVVYIGLATVLTVGTRRQRFAVAGAVVTLVGFSRVVLGVHFLVDVVAGVATGTALVALAFQVGDRTPGSRETAVFAGAVVLNAFYVVTSDGHVEAVLMLGASVGLLAGWRLLVYARRRGLSSISLSFTR